jgi:beta-mannanase
VFVRFAHEMNDPYRYPWGPQHNTKEEFIAAWRHVVERFRAAGAGNVIWVWSPHVAYEYWDLYYPGDEFVDWAATGVLNFGPIASGRGGGRSTKSSARSTSGWPASAGR